MDHLIERFRALGWTAFEITVSLLDKTVNQLMGLLSHWMFGFIFGEVSRAFK